MWEKSIRRIRHIILGVIHLSDMTDVGEIRETWIFNN